MRRFGRYRDGVTPTLPDVGSDPRRLIRLDAVHNFRDMGGYPTADGRTTRWRTLFRADGLYRLTGDDLEAGARARAAHGDRPAHATPSSHDRGTFPHDRHPVDFHHVPVIDSTWQHLDRRATPTTRPTSWSGPTTTCCDEGAQRFAEALEQLSQPDALPAVFHCAAGKDRTGMLAMLVLGCLGVPHEYIVADYALTAEGMERMRAWPQREVPGAVRAHRLAAVGVPGRGARGDVAHDRHHLRAHGSIRDYTLSLGVTPDAPSTACAANCST